MEYLIVRFAESRVVRVDGTPYGRTNIILQLEAGRHRIALAPPYNVSPLEQLIELVYTSAMDPYEIVFRRLPPSAVPLSPGSAG